MSWFSRFCIYWLNGWQLAFTYALGKTWFLLSLAGFLPLLRAAMQQEAQGRVRLADPYRVEAGAGPAYRPHDADRLRKRLRRR